MNKSSLQSKRTILWFLSWPLAMVAAISMASTTVAQETPPTTQPAAEVKVPKNLSTPRATGRTFFEAMDALPDDPDRINEEWGRGKMPDIVSRARVLGDSDRATVARVEVDHPEGLPVRYCREFVFVKNGYLVTREIAVYTHHHDHDHDLHGEVIEHSDG